MRFKVLLWWLLHYARGVANTVELSKVDNIRRWSLRTALKWGRSCHVLWPRAKYCLWFVDTIHCTLKPGTHWWHSRQLPKLATKSTVDFVADLSPVCRKSTVAGLFDFVKRVTVDIVDKGRHCRQSWTSSTQSTLSKVGNFCRLNVAHPFDIVASVYWGQSDTVDLVDFRQSRRCRIRLYRQCAIGSATIDILLFTF